MTFHRSTTCTSARTESESARAEVLRVSLTASCHPSQADRKEKLVRAITLRCAFEADLCDWRDVGDSAEVARRN